MSSFQFVQTHTDKHTDATKNNTCLTGGQVKIVDLLTALLSVMRLINAILHSTIYIHTF